jgi:hypothetical protein
MAVSRQPWVELAEVGSPRRDRQGSCARQANASETAASKQGRRAGIRSAGARPPGRRSDLSRLPAWHIALGDIAPCRTRGRPPSSGRPARSRQARGLGARPAMGRMACAGRDTAPLPGPRKAAGVRSPGVSRQHAAKRSTPRGRMAYRREHVRPSASVGPTRSRSAQPQPRWSGRGLPLLQDGPRALMASRSGCRGALRRRRPSPSWPCGPSCDCSRNGKDAQIAAIPQINPLRSFNLCSGLGVSLGP